MEACEFGEWSLEERAFRQGKDKRDSQGKDPRTFAGNIQEGDSGTLRRNSQVRTETVRERTQAPSKADAVRWKGGEFMKSGRKRKRKKMRKKQEKKTKRKSRKR